MRVLLLGGTKEARELATALVERGHDVVTSLAGRTREPVPVFGAVRVGGFGGADGFAAYLRAGSIERLIDATHPFAGTISRNAADAAARTGVRRLALDRAPWQAVPGDRWHRASDLGDAAETLPTGARVLLALGRQHLAPFAARGDVAFVVRAIEPFEPPLACTVLLERPGASVADEIDLLKRHAIDRIVSRNSGGAGAYAKIAAARRLGLGVTMVDRPPPPPPPVFGTVDELLDAL